VGYYSAFDYNIEGAKVDPQKVQEIVAYFKDDGDNSKDIWGFSDVQIEVVGDKLESIELDEYYAKFYDDELFAKRLAEAIVEGSVDLYFTGEDGTKWGFRITPGKVTLLRVIWVPDEEVEYAQ
jgi:hypothetical protein